MAYYVLFYFRYEAVCYSLYGNSEDSGFRQIIIIQSVNVSIIEDNGPARKLCICPERTQYEIRPDAKALVAVKKNQY